MMTNLYELLWERAFSHGYSFSPTAEIAFIVVVVHAILMFAIKGIEVRQPILVFGFVGRYIVDADSNNRNSVSRLVYAAWVLVFVLQVFSYKFPIFNVMSKRETIPMVLTASMFFFGTYFTLGWGWVFWNTIL